MGEKSWIYLAGEVLRPGDLLAIAAGRGRCRLLSHTEAEVDGLAQVVGVSGGEFAAGTRLVLDGSTGLFVAAAGDGEDAPARAETWRDRPPLL
jgi:hypothetical protein